MKKTIAICCFAALLLSTSSLSLFYWVQEQWHEQEIFSSIDAGELEGNEHKIKLILQNKAILPEGYQWEEKGREFSHEGMFYDIVSLIKTEAGWELVAVSDKEEAEIVAKQSKAGQLDKDIAGQHHSKKQNTNFNFSLYDQYFETIYLKELAALNQPAYSNYKANLTQLFLGQISPPPKAV